MRRREVGPSSPLWCSGESLQIEVSIRSDSSNILIARILCEPLLLSSSNMPVSERLWASSNKKPRRSSLYLYRVVILSICLTSAFSYTQARGRPDRSGLRVQWNVTGKAERERERDVQRASELLVGCHVSQLVSATMRCMTIHFTS